MLTVEPAPYVSLASGDETDTTRGASVSIAMSFEWDSDPRSPGSGRVRFAAFRTLSAIVPPPRWSESVPA